MARILTGGVADLVGLDFNDWFSSRTGWSLASEDAVTVRSVVYDDTYRLDHGGPGSPVWLYGSGLTVDARGRLIGGTIEGFAIGPDQFDPVWIIQFLTLPAADVFAAFLTASRADDEAVLRLMLAGNDSVLLREGPNEVRGYDGNDTIAGDRGNDTLYGGNGDDSLTGFFGDDVLYGGNGNDTLSGSVGNDRAFGGAGNDRIVLQDSNATVRGGTGDDYIGLRSGNTDLRGERGNDTIAGGWGLDTVDGGAGADVLYGGDSADVVRGGTRADTLYGGDGDDDLAGGDGGDVLSGDDDRDTLSGGGGADVLQGGLDEDLLLGGAGNDTLDGGSANDTLAGGAGDDSLTGGTGADRFEFGRGGGEDLVTDFVPTGFFGDRLALSDRLWRAEFGVLSAEEVENLFASVDAQGRVVLDFGAGGTRIVLQGFGDLESLDQYLLIV